MRPSIKRALIVSIAFVVLCLVTAGLWLPWFGRALVANETPVKADAVICLAGDSTGRRMGTAMALVKDGWAPTLLVSGPNAIYETNEADLAIDWAVKRGFPREKAEPVRHFANSTLEEAWVFRDYLRRRGIKRVLLVTSDYHTGRATRTFRSIVKEVEFHPVAAPDQDFQAESWWKNRPARKLVFYEWTKTVAYALGI